MPPRQPLPDATWPDDAGYLGRMVALAGQVAATVPATSPAGWRRIAYRAVLSAVLRDAVENETTDLESEDSDNLSRFVRDASSVAQAAGPEHQDDAFEIVLNSLLEDWVDNRDSPLDDDDDLDDLP